MIIDTNRVAAYLAGNFSPYYQAFPKIEFILLLSSKAGNVFTDEKLKLIETHTSSLQQFYSESLNLLKNQQELLSEIVETLKVPFDAKGKDFVVPNIGQESSTTAENQKTIGFITPFDDVQSFFQPFIQEILNKDYPGWKLETANLKKSENGKYVWDHIEAFLNKYPFYIIDFRIKKTHKENPSELISNVSLELGYLLAKNKKYFIITENGDLPSDLKGFVYINKDSGTINPGGNGGEDQKEIDTAFEKKIKEKFDEDFQLQ